MEQFNFATEIPSDYLEDETRMEHYENRGRYAIGKLLADQLELGQPYTVQIKKRREARGNGFGSRFFSVTDTYTVTIGKIPTMTAYSVVGNDGLSDTVDTLENENQIFYIRNVQLNEQARATNSANRSLRAENENLKSTNQKQMNAIKLFSVLSIVLVLALVLL